VAVSPTEEAESSRRTPRDALAAQPDHSILRPESQPARRDEHAALLGNASDGRIDADRGWSRGSHSDTFVARHICRSALAGAGRVGHCALSVVNAKVILVCSGLVDHRADVGCRLGRSGRGISRTGDLPETGRTSHCVGRCGHHRYGHRLVRRSNRTLTQGRAGE